MANDNDSLQTDSRDNSALLEKTRSQGPYENVILRAIAKIKNEPFLFVIALAALLIGLTTLSTNLGSGNLRFVVIVIAFLAFAVIVGYYLLAVLQIPQDQRVEKPPTVQHNSLLIQDGPDVPKIAAPGKYTVNASHAHGVAVGDGARVEQHFPKQEDQQLDKNS